MSKRAPGRKPRVQYSSGKDHRRTISAKEARVMGTIGKRILTVAVGLLLAAGVPYVAATTVHADPGCGCECDRGEHQGMHEGMHGKEGGHMHGRHMGDEGPMKEGMTRHMEEVRGTILKLRALEAKM